MASVPNSLPETVWLCRIEWPLGEWRVRLHSEPSRGGSAAYRLERRPDGSAETAMDGAYLYRHDVDAEDDSLDDVYGEAPPVDEYRLSTRPGVVSGGQ